MHTEWATYINLCNEAIWPDTFDAETDCYAYWINSDLHNLKRIALIVLKSAWNEAGAERSFSVYTNITKNKQQASMSKYTKRVKQFVLWNKNIIKRVRFGC